LEELADKDDELTESAKAKVGQAKTDSEDVQKQMQKALDSIKSIVSELENMKEISIQDLDLLGIIIIIVLSFIVYWCLMFSDKKLNATESELERAKLNERIDSLRGLRNHQNSDMKGYKSEISQLEKEVANVKQISSALPNGNLFLLNLVQVY
jgi:laminin, gamma 1